MRSGYSGSQKYGMIPWSGDVNRTWGGLRSQTEIALQMGMQGLGYMHSDLGGFAGANLDDELYVRWLQYGVFQPIFRPHAQEEVASEPIFRSEKAKALAKTAIELRYRMLPYNYTLAFENNQTGIPLMRPLFFNEPENKHYLSDASTYLWGDAILVRPITSPGEKMVSINFPKENAWFDFYNDARFNGNTKYEYAVVKDSIPTFVKAGSFVPLVPSNIHLQSTQAYSADSIELHYYHDETVNQSNGQLYDDDGLLSQAYEKKMYRITHFNSEYSKLKSNHFLSIQLQDELGMKRKFEKRNWNFVIHNIFSHPIALTINGKKLSFKWDEKKNLLLFNVSNNDIQAKQIKLKW